MTTDSLKTVFRDIVNVKGVRAVFLISLLGQILFQKFTFQSSENMKEKDWIHLLSAMDGIREMDVIFDRLRLYARSTSFGILIVLMNNEASSALVRLNCDLVIPMLKEAVSPKRHRLFGECQKKTFPTEVEK